jgi:transcription elongation GreA/GreB family factor
MRSIKPPNPSRKSTRLASRNFRTRLVRAEVIDVSRLSGDTVKFGATVTVIDEDTNEKRVWQIVGEPEADAKKRKISIFSPLARALIGKTKGATIEVLTPEAPGLIGSAKWNGVEVWRLAGCGPISIN